MPDQLAQPRRVRLPWFQREQQALATTYKGVPGAIKALRELADSGSFVVAKTGAREWRIQPKQGD